MKPFSRRRRAVLIGLLLVVLTLVPFVAILLKRLGKNPTGQRLLRIVKSPNYRDDAFQNPQPTEVMAKNASMVELTKDILFKPDSVRPSRPLPSVRTDLKHLITEMPTVVWFGHSSYLIQSNGYTVLVDPVFSGNASPVPFFGKAFDGADAYGVDDLPLIDVLLITHDHYDHLDYATVVALKDKVKRVVTSLGVGSHLEYWGYNPAMITELNWNEAITLAPNVQFTAVPARHFSGRTFKRAQTLWSAFVLELHGYKLFLGGDSGYGEHFKAIGEQHGPFDLAFLENGQYGKDWPDIHMFPEHLTTTAAELRAAMIMPVHWAKFALSVHPWNEPIKRLLAAASTHHIPVTVPKIGEVYRLGDPARREVWWDFV